MGRLALRWLVSFDTQAQVKERTVALPATIEY